MRLMIQSLKQLACAVLAFSLSVPALAEATERSQRPDHAKASSANKHAKTSVRKSTVRAKGSKYARAKVRHGRSQAQLVRRGTRSRMQARQQGLRVSAVPVARQYLMDPDIQSSIDISRLDLQSSAAMIVNAETGETIYGKNAQRTMPIASITKLMTAMVVLDAGLPLDEPIIISEADVDVLKHTSSRLTVGTVLTRGEALLLALMASENRAAASLARTYPGGTSAAIAAMNRKARDIGMTHTHFYDGTGLNTGNTASPSDLATMVRNASRYPEIRHYSTQPQYELLSHGHHVAFRNTNPLVRSEDWDINVTKTGFINEAGKCLVMHTRINDKPFIIVLMDSWGKYTRIGDANRVKKWLESTL